MQDTAGYNTYRAFGSAHPNGAFFVLCDGSVQKINYTIDFTTFYNLGDREDGFVIDGNAF